MRVALQLPVMDSSAPAGIAPPSLSLTDTLLDANSAAADGGGIALLSGAATLFGGTLSGNAAGADGGGISVKARGSLLALCAFGSGASALN